MGSLLLGLADGDLTPRQAAGVAKQSFPKTLSTAELERELRKLVEGS